MKVIYIAGPFRAPSTLAVRENILRAEKLGFEVARLGAMPLIPHANTGTFDGALPATFMLAGTMELMRRCDAVVLVEGWERSRGSLGEIEEAKRLGIPWFVSIAALESWLACGGPPAIGAPAPAPAARGMVDPLGVLSLDLMHAHLNPPEPPPNLDALRAERDELARDVEAHAGGDRPSSPAVWKLRRLAELDAALQGAWLDKEPPR